MHLRILTQFLSSFESYDHIDSKNIFKESGQSRSGALEQFETSPKITKIRFSWRFQRFWKMKTNDSVFLLWKISTWSLDSFGEKLGWTHLLLTLELRVSRTSTWWFDFENLLWQIDYSEKSILIRPFTNNFQKLIMP